MVFTNTAQASIIHSSCVQFRQARELVVSSRSILRYAVLMIFFGFSLFLIAGCASNQSDSANQSNQDSQSKVDGADTKSGPEQAVAIAGSAFQPADVTIKSGTAVTWTNQDDVQHQVHDDSGAFLSDPIGKGDTVKVTYSAPGTFTYHCHRHSNMKGKFTVE